MSKVNIHKTYSFAVLCAYTLRPKLRCQFVYLLFLLLFPFCTECIKWKSLKSLMLKQTDHDADNTYFAQYQQTLVIYITLKFLFPAKSCFLKYFVSIQLSPLAAVLISEEKDGYEILHNSTECFSLNLVLLIN